MNCYVKDFGRERLAVCEQQIARGLLLTVTKVLHADPTPELWAELGAMLGRAGDVVEAQ